MKIKVYGGTTCENICLKCTNLREIQGTRESDTIRLCNATQKKIPFEVARCSFYREKEPNLERYKGALNLVFSKKKQKLFVVESRGPFAEPTHLTVDQYRDQCATEAVSKPATESPTKASASVVN